ncbi:hypothetical protein RJ640_012795 [Escallonia rubra]|uniref:FCP1 homology domain-containing protein n=1 Tax=Escallonia rubra TaxID=112253 RepID=A0AA88S103_9ASTE|nr:hypothetical protein RJ640_012795 [Escallonia rubra]
MPSLKMKTKSTISYLREKNGLRVCQNSSMKSKSSFPHIRICQQAAEFETSTRSKLDGPFCNKSCVQNNGDAAAGCFELLGEENLQFQKQLSPSTDYATATRMESAPATCASNLETIFSPVLESTDNHSERIADSDGGTLDMLPLGADDSDDNSRSSSGYQTCNVSDFYFSDMIVSGLPIEGNSVHDDFTETTSLADYKCDEPSTFFNENYMILPFLEDTMESSKGHDSRLSEETVTDSDDSSLYLAIHQLRSCNQEPDVNTYLDWDQAEFFDPHMFIRNLPDLSDVAPNSHSAQKMKLITLVLDLDETLVHSTLEHCDDADFTFPVVVNMKEHIVYVKQRPYLQAFLERVAEMFEIVVFTASQSIYAKQLLDILDPEGKLIARRAYRESCIFTDGSYTKDLTVLGVDLSKIVIIDNSPQVFRLQVNNGIPIRSWFDDPSDSALVSLLPFLETLVDAEDVRPIIAKRFGNKE